MKKIMKKAMSPLIRERPAIFLLAATKFKIITTSPQSTMRMIIAKIRIPRIFIEELKFEEFSTLV